MKRPARAPTLSAALQEGLDGLAFLDGLDVLDGPIWDMKCQRWVLRFRLTIDPGHGRADLRRTTWYALINPAYPSGGITILPAKVGGITQTFEHQSRNTAGRADQPWNNGNICVHGGGRALGRLGDTGEPLDAARRLRWRLERAREWVAAAAAGTLSVADDPYELPDFGPSNERVFGFYEDADSFRFWEHCDDIQGVAMLYSPTGLMATPARVVVSEYHDLTGTRLYRPSWGKAFTPSRERDLRPGLWIRLPQVPHRDPWKAPETWGELVDCAADADIDLDALVLSAAKHLRRHRRSLLLCGFPMPARVGQPNIEYFWQALELPELSSPTGILPGFRNTEPNRRFIDHLRRLRRATTLTWIRSENWHPSTRSARGRFAPALTGKHVLLIGTGALGSAIAELLVRGGVERLTLCDEQVLLSGNLVRHTLTLPDVGRAKTTGLVHRLNQASPLVTVDAVAGPFPPTAPDDARRVEEADLVLDCTGEDEVAHALAAFGWARSRTFGSFSLDWHARRLFCYLSDAATFPAHAFLTEVDRQLANDRDRGAARELAREGVGCWHPVMPARIDHVWMLAATAARFLDDALKADKRPTGLVVYERDDSPTFSGISRVV